MKITLQNQIIFYIIKNNINYKHFSICSIIDEIIVKSDLMIDLYNNHYYNDCFIVSINQPEIIIQYFIKRLENNWNLVNFITNVCKNYFHHHIKYYIFNSNHNQLQNLLLKCDNIIYIQIINYILKYNSNFIIQNNGIELDILSNNLYFQPSNYEIIKFLIKLNKININYINKNGSTPLMFACQYQNLKIIKFLIENNADINIINKNYNKNSIMWAAYSDDYDPEIITYLLNQGAQFDLVDDDNKSLLYYACKNNDFENIKFLLNNLNNIDLNSKEYNNILPLIFNKKDILNLFITNNILTYETLSQYYIKSIQN